MIQTGILFVPEMDDHASQVIRQRLREALPQAIVMMENSARSQRHWIEETLRRWCDEEELDLVLTVGGTLPAPGPSQREIVPEATNAVLERLLPGVSEAMRAEASGEVDLALLDRGVAGIRGRSLLINLPAGSAPALLFLQAVIDLIDPILAHLQERPSAPQLAELLEIESTTDPGEDPPTLASDSTPSAPVVPAIKKGLNPEDFAAFLQRNG